MTEREDAQLYAVAKRLTVASVHAAAEATPLGWPAEIPDDAWCMSPELVSIYGLPAWDALDEAGRRRLAFFECVNFFTLNIHGERALMEGIARRLYVKDLRPSTPTTCTTSWPRRTST